MRQRQAMYVDRVRASFCAQLLLEVARHFKMSRDDWAALVQDGANQNRPKTQSKYIAVRYGFQGILESDLRANCRETSAHCRQRGACSHQKALLVEMENAVEEILRSPAAFGHHLVCPEEECCQAMVSDCEAMLRRYPRLYAAVGELVLRDFRHVLPRLTRAPRRPRPAPRRQNSTLPCIFALLLAGVAWIPACSIPILCTQPH